MHKNWLITGGCGFIGCNLIDFLVKTGGHHIRVIDNLNVGSREDLDRVCQFVEISENRLNAMPQHHNSVELIVGDILDGQLAVKLCKDMDVIVHLAANTGVAPSVKDPMMDCQINVMGTLNYLQAARTNHVGRFIFASSGAPAGEVEPPIHEEVVPHPVSPYGASKLAGEAYCSAYYRTYGIDTVCLRFGNVFGPLSDKKESVVAKFIKQGLKRAPLIIYGEGNQTRDFIFVEDLIAAIMKASTAPAVGGEVFQIATNFETTVNELADILLSIFLEHDLSKPDISFAESRPGDVMRNYSDTSKAKRMLGWECKYALREALYKTFTWFYKRYGV